LINNLHPAFRLPISHKNVKELVSEVMANEDCVIDELVLNFVSDSKIRSINKKHLKHVFFTDIITFPYNSDKKQIEGELFISLDTVRKNGKFYGSGYKDELKRVIIHGCLHLAGYNDRTKTQKELIRARENYYLSN
jgi:probable rRNA maturation factor